MTQPKKPNSRRNLDLAKNGYDVSLLPIQIRYI